MRGTKPERVRVRVRVGEEGARAWDEAEESAERAEGRVDLV